MKCGQFQVGEVYFGTLCVAHGDFPVRCIKRTDKSVWFEHVTLPQHYKTGRALIRKASDGECAMFCRWYIDSKKQTGGDFDPMTI
jgi:hypothetical protein